MDPKTRRMLQSLVAATEEGYHQSCWQPSADIYRVTEGWLVKFDLAGVRPEDIRVRAEGRRLTVEGIRRDLSIIEGQQAYSMEISYNRFERSIELPCDLEQVQVKSDYRDGMLLVSIEMRRAPQ